jgi:uncharacterized protein YcaQ
VHDRARAEALYEFHYRWEIYTPERKRAYGPYALPIHAGDQIVGRIQLHREAIGDASALVVDNLWWEPRARPTKHLVGLAQAIRTHQQLIGATSGRIPASLASRSDGRRLFTLLRRSVRLEERAPRSAASS